MRLLSVTEPTRSGTSSVQRDLPPTSLPAAASRRPPASPHSRPGSPRGASCPPDTEPKSGSGRDLRGRGRCGEGGRGAQSPSLSHTPGSPASPVAQQPHGARERHAKNILGTSLPVRALPARSSRAEDIKRGCEFFATHRPEAGCSPFALNLAGLRDPLGQPGLRGLGRETPLGTLSLGALSHRVRSPLPGGRHRGGQPWALRPTAQLTRRLVRGVIEAHLQLGTSQGPPRTPCDRKQCPAEPWPHL